MTTDPTFVRSFAATVDWLYAGLIPAISPDEVFDPERGLGGKLLYAGELDGAGRALLVAANIAGAASLVATTGVIAQKQAVRDGVIDFLVTTLGEALRILKNEIRKGETVAVCVAQSTEDLEQEMLELGVLPDLLPPGVLEAPRYEAFISLGARQVNPVSANSNNVVLTWSVAANPTQWMPKLDAIARDSIGVPRNPETWRTLRWLRLSPRYLGKLAEGVRLLRCEKDAALEFLHRVQESVARGEIGAQVDVRLSSGGHSQLHQFIPPPVDEAGDNLSFADHQQPQSGSKVL